LENQKGFFLTGLKKEGEGSLKLSSLRQP